MAETVSAPRAALPGRAQYSRDRTYRLVAGGVLWAFYAGNIGAIVWLWIANDNLNFAFAPDYWATLMARLGGLTGLLAAFTALVQLLLLARLPFLGRLIGFDRLVSWHRWNGYLCLLLVLAHTVMAILGFSLDGKRSFFAEYWKLVAGGILTGMVTATIGLVLFVVVTVSSVAIARRHLNYELWYAVHLTAYAAIAFAWFHQIPTGGDINPTFHPDAAAYWRLLFFGTIALIVVFRVLGPIVSAFRFRLRVAEVIAEGPTVTTIRITGRRLERLHARPGQFLIWRFLAPGFWWTAHPFSLSAAPDGRSLRISVKAAGDHTRRLRTLRVGTRVVAEGPYGFFTAAARRRPNALLIAGGIGITPVRALAETMEGKVTIVYRVLTEEDIVFGPELAELAERRGLDVRYVVGDHLAAEGRDLLSAAHLRELVPDLASRDVYLCGPPAMVSALEGSVRGAGVPRRSLHVERFAL